MEQRSNIGNPAAEKQFGRNAHGNIAETSEYENRENYTC
jgi:hypothetical protein